MSEAKRYSMMWGEDEDGCIYVSPFEHLHGDWVRHGDYARLKAEVQTFRHQAVHDVSQLGEQSAEIANLKVENEELHKDYEALADEHTKLIDRNARLKAEVARLRKAGDAVALDYAERIEIEAGETAKTLMKIVPVLREWTAAKEDKPSV